MTKELWEDFSNSVSSNLTKHKTPLTTNSKESIETTWHKIQHAITSSATQCIPNKKSRKRSYNHQYTSNSTKLHNSLKKLEHLIKHTKNNNMSLNFENINNQLQLIN